MLTLRSHPSRQTSLGAPASAPSRHRASRGLIKLALLVPITALAFGCSAAGDIDGTASAVILVINSITPVVVDTHTFGDVITNGTLYDDTVLATLSAHLKAPISTNPTTLTPELQDIILDRFEVTFTRTDGGTSVPPGFVRGITARVRLTELGSDELVETEVGLTIFPNTTKAQPPVSYLVSPGSEPDTNYVNIQVQARIQFFGRTLSGDEVTATGYLGINLANFGDPETG